MLLPFVAAQLSNAHEMRVRSQLLGSSAETAPPSPEGAVQRVQVRQSNVSAIPLSLQERRGPFEELCVISVKDVPMTFIIPLSLDDPASINGELDVCI